MKAVLMVVAAIICVANVGFAQTDTLYRFNSIHFQALFEPIIGTGEFYENIADSPFRLGLRTGVYGFASRTLALGLDFQVSTITESFNVVGSVALGGGPGMLIVGKRRSSRGVFFFKTYCHFVYNSNPIKGRNKKGAEMGMQIGGMRPFGGLMYGFGMAYDAIPRYPDGFKIFVDIGFGTAINHRPKPSKTNHGRAVILRVISEFGYAGGGLYETVTDNRFQYGIRTGFYSYVSSITGIGISARILATASERRAIGYGIGPGIIIADRSNSNSYGWHARLYTEVTSQSWKKPRSSETNHGGAEIGIGLGRSKSRGGYICEIGTAYDIVSGLDNGYRIFVDFGYAI